MPNPILMRRLGGSRRADPKWYVESFDTYLAGSDLEDGNFKSGNETTPDGVYFFGPWSGGSSFVPQWYGLEDFSSYADGSDLEGANNGEYFDGAWSRTIAPGPGVDEAAWWLEAESITGVADNANVNLWPDKSTFDLAAEPDPFFGPPTILTPIFKTNIINGFSVVRHTNSVKDMLNIVSSGLTMFRNREGGTIVCVAKAAEVVNTARLLANCEFTGAGATIFQLRLGSGAAPKFGIVGRRVAADGAALLYDGDDYDTGWHVYAGTVSWVDRRLRIYIDGVQKNEVTGVFASAGRCDNATDTRRITVGHFAEGFYGDRLAQVHWTKELTSTEVSAVTAYYKAKYGI